ncbi:hypothetical protein Tco_1555498 [Tanacetum coccineum]
MGVQSTSTATPSSSKTAASAEYTAWMTTDTRIKPSVSSTPEELYMDDNTTADKQAYSSGGEDIGRDHIPMMNLRQSWWKPLTKDKPATPEHAWSIPSSDLTILKNNWASALTQGITELTQKDLDGPAYEIVKVFHPNVIHLQFQMEECHKLLTDQVDDAILSYNEALSSLKSEGAYYPDLGKHMVPDQMWIEEECKHTSEDDRRAIRTHMRILSFVRIEVFSLYGYDYMKKIVLRRADLKEYIITERDFKYLYPSDFEDLYLHRVEDFQLGIESYQTQLNLTKPRWDANGFEYKHSFTIIDSPRAVTFRDKYEVQMIMRFNEIHKFSDGTLQQIDEALDYRVKEFKVKRMNSAQDKENLQEPGKLYWWTDKRRRLQTAEENRMISSSRARTHPEERIKRTKRSKNSQKPTRNERDKKKSEETAKDQSRISPTQQERQSKDKIEKSRTKSDKLSKFKVLFRSLKFQGLKLSKWKCVYKERKRKKERQGLKVSFSNFFNTTKGAEQKTGTNCAITPNL